MKFTAVPASRIPESTSCRMHLDTDYALLVTPGAYPLLSGIIQWTVVTTSSRSQISSPCILRLLCTSLCHTTEALRPTLGYISSSGRPSSTLAAREVLHKTTHCPYFQTSTMTGIRHEAHDERPHHQRKGIHSRCSFAQDLRHNRLVCNNILHFGRVIVCVIAALMAAHHLRINTRIARYCSRITILSSLSIFIDLIHASI